jgi:hypothetical protein
MPKQAFFFSAVNHCDDMFDPEFPGIFSATVMRLNMNEGG